LEEKLDKKGKEKKKEEGILYLF